MKQKDKSIEDILEKMLEKIHQGDPIKKKWIYLFYDKRRKDMNSSLSLDQFCIIMERDEKLKQIIEE